MVPPAVYEMNASPRVQEASEAGRERVCTNKIINPDQCWRQQLLQPGCKSEAVEFRCEVKDPKGLEEGTGGFRSRQQAVKKMSGAGDQAELNFLRQSGIPLFVSP